MTPTSAPDLPELLPCPFCGSKDIDPEGVAFYPNGDKNKGIQHAPACNNCNATSDNWNTRPGPTSGAEALDIEAEIKSILSCCLYDTREDVEKDLRRVIAALATPVGWRDIETAPKDGTEVLFYSKKYGVFSANIPKDMAHYKKPECIYRGGCRRVLYWMPLPPTPPHTEERG